MNVVGSILFFLVGTFCLIWAFKRHRKSPVDYIQMYRVSSGKVWGTYDYYGKRWLVKFVTDNGQTVYGADDFLAGEIFHPENYKIPKPGDNIGFYYWPLKQPYTHSINDIPIACRIHFYDERYYELAKKKIKSTTNGIMFFALFMIVMGAMILLFGNS